MFGDPWHSSDSSSFVHSGGLWSYPAFFMPCQEEDRVNIYNHWHRNEKASETKSTNTSSMLLRVSIHKKYSRMSEEKIMRQRSSLNRFSPSLLGPQQKGGWLGSPFHCQHWLLPSKQTGHSVLSSRQLFSGWLEISINQSSFYRSHFPWLRPRSLTQGEIFLSMAWQPQVSINFFLHFLHFVYAFSCGAVVFIGSHELPVRCVCVFV